VGIACRRDREIPLGIQLEWGLRSAIVRGELASGERLPPLRELAEDVGAHVNTIRAVYARLEQDGLIDTRHGKGSFVLAQPTTAHLGLAGALTHAARVALDAGVTAEQLAAALYVLPDDLREPDAEAVARRDLRAQIAVLEGALSALYAEHPDLPVVARPTARRAGPRILDREDLRRQRDAVLHQLVEIHAALDERANPVPAPAVPAARKTAGAKQPAPAGAPRKAARPRVAPA
jgi:DNA-binding transcriptional regulator YhcF (GntR family)